MSDTLPDPATVQLAQALVMDHRLSTVGGLCTATSCWVKRRQHPCDTYTLAREVLDKAGGSQ